MATDHSNMKLGKRAPVHDRSTLQFANYYDRTLLPKPPQARSWFLHDINWGQFLNDQISDCVTAAFGHMIQLWTSVTTGTAATLPDSAILAAYEAISGYVPGQPATDVGCSMIEALSYFQRIGIAGVKIMGSAAVHPGDQDMIRRSIDIFGLCDIGLNLPKTAATQDVWDVPPGGPVGDGLPGSWGGHSVILGGFDPSTFEGVTWGQRKKMTLAFIHTYCDEADCVLSGNWLANKRAPNGLNLAKLRADLVVM